MIEVFLLETVLFIATNCAFVYGERILNAIFKVLHMENGGNSEENQPRK